MTEGSHTSKTEEVRWKRLCMLPISRLSSFNALFEFANHSLPNIDEGNYRNVPWQAMGEERLCVGTYITPEGVIKKRTWATEFSGDDKVQELTPFIPTIFGQEASSLAVEKLRHKLNCTLDFMVSKVGSVSQQRESAENTDWIKRAREHSVNFKLFGVEPDYLILPWSVTHFKEHNEIIDFVLRAFCAKDSREAIIHRGDFVCFVDEGEDAARTLSRMLILLADLVFERERAIIKKCPCEKYFVHITLKYRKYCGTSCRYKHSRR